MRNNPLHFTKMHGLGNDFMIINAMKQTIDPATLQISQLAHRHFGVGFDQLLIIQPSKHADFFCRIFNADGSEAEQCGNGLRCIARYIHEEKLLPQSSFKIETKAGVFPIRLHDYDNIQIAFDLKETKETHVQLDLNGDSVTAYIFSMGNPHTIMKVKSIDELKILTLAKEISQHELFPNGINVGFMQIIHPSQIRLRTFERGVGETFACGSNACAAVCVGILHQWLEHQVQVEFPHGHLLIEWEGQGKPLYMTGPAAKVFDGITE